MSFPTVRVSAVVAAASLAVGLAIVAPTGVAFAQQQQQTQHPSAAGTAHVAAATATTAGKGAQSGKEDHPKMEAALKDLDKARGELASAAHDFEGHRAKALELVTEAKEEIRQGLASDKD
ncbi:MAG: hypothetical protein U1E42_02895 [Rhodospirillales bacterium]